MWDYDAEPTDGLAEHDQSLDDGIEWVDYHPGSRALKWAWTLVLSAALGGAGLLEVLGPPRDGSAHAAAAQVATDQAKPVAGPARAARLRVSPHLGIETVSASLPSSLPSSSSVPALLARVQSQIADSPDSPPGDSAAEALRRISAALPQAAPEDRERVQNLASELFDKARTAVESGKVDEEQRWLALGSILAPPPDISPGETTDTATQPNGGSEARQDITPNEAEADQAVQDRQAGSTAPPRPPEAKVTEAAAADALKPAPSAPDPSTVPGRKAATIPEAQGPDQHPGDLPVGGLPGLRAPNARPPTLDETRVGQAAPTSPALPADEPARMQSPARSWRAPTQSDFGQPGSPGADGALWRQRVVIHYPTDSAPAASEAHQIAASLARKAGEVEIRAVNAVPSSPSIRYFYPADLGAAEKLGELLRDAGGRWTEQAFTAYEPKPRPGTIEVWIARG